MERELSMRPFWAGRRCGFLQVLSRQFTARRRRGPGVRRPLAEAARSANSGGRGAWRLRTDWTGRGSEASVGRGGERATADRGPRYFNRSGARALSLPSLSAGLNGASESSLTLSLCLTQTKLAARGLNDAGEPAAGAAPGRLVGMIACLAWPETPLCWASGQTAASDSDEADVHVPVHVLRPASISGGWGGAGSSPAAQPHNRNGDTAAQSRCLGAKTQTPTPRTFPARTWPAITYRFFRVCRLRLRST